MNVTEAYMIVTATQHARTGLHRTTVHVMVVIMEMASTAQVIH